MKIKIIDEVEIKLQKHVESEYPHEACGFMFGIDGETRLIKSILPVSNISEDNKKRRFKISPTDYLKAETFALKNNLILLGIYHSHPDHPPIPSEHDLSAALPYFSYVISSVRYGYLDETKSWRLNDDKIFEEEKVQLELQTI